LHPSKELYVRASPTFVFEKNVNKPFCLSSGKPLNSRKRVLGKELRENDIVPDTPDHPLWKGVSSNFDCKTEKLHLKENGSYMIQMGYKLKAPQCKMTRT